MNKIYIFDRIDQLTDSYHSSGGLVVIATNDNHAKKLIAEYRSENNYGDHQIMVSDEEWNSATVGNTDLEPMVKVFPDAGCC